jgi:hypothetical protein
MVERYKYFGDLQSTTASNAPITKAFHDAATTIATHFQEFERQTVNRIFGIPDTPPAPSVLTEAKLRQTMRMVDALRCFIAVHADDAGRQPVKDLVAAGYDLQISAYMPVGFGFFQTPEQCGHIDFANGTAMVWENPALRLDPKWPPYWNTSATDRLTEQIALKMCPPVPWTYREPV